MYNSKTLQKPTVVNIFGCRRKDVVKQKGYGMKET